ncbi:unnamed protein product [Coffea canephora]|uniref:Uncharacterized protein n=1 Tax=Coffea canephora TaxID=49390 RepID=A0A068UX57_COFCA|nr:unnamed protein product [Coffea canephora]
MKVQLRLQSSCLSFRTKSASSPFLVLEIGINDDCLIGCTSKPSMGRSFSRLNISAVMGIQ